MQINPVCDIASIVSNPFGDYIQDEKHVIFSCIGTEHLRHQFIHLFDNISDCDIKVLFFNITQKFTNLLVQLSVTTQVVINQQFIRYNQVHSASVLASDHHACQPGVTPIRKV
jgi:hypothetical protein